MEPISRRSVMGIAASVLAGGVLASGESTASGGAPDDKSSSEPRERAAAKSDSDSPYKYSLSTAHIRHYGASTVREHKLEDFPMSASISATLISLAPGDIREPHWHPNSDEWLMVMTGKIQMTIVNAKGEASQFDCGVEDVAFTPQGYGHYVESIGDVPAKLMLIHNHADFTTIHLSEWVGAGSAAVFASTLKIPVQALDKSPTKKVFIVPNDTKK